MKPWLPLCALFFSFLAPLPAQALKLAVVGAGNYSNADTAASSGYSAKTGLGIGGLVEFRLLPAIGLEIGALYVPRSFEINAGGSTYTTKQNLLQVPVMLRANLMNVLSLGIGGYYGKYLGSPAYDITGGVGPTNRREYGQGGLAASDYGTIASLAFYKSLAPLTRIVLDARYVISAKASDELEAERKFRDFQVLLGIQMGI